MHRLQFLFIWFDCVFVFSEHHIYI